MSLLVIGSGLIGTHIAKECWLRNRAEVRILSSKIDIPYVKQICNFPSSHLHETAVVTADELLLILQRYTVDELVIAAGSLLPAFLKHTGLAVLNETRLMLSVQAACMRHRIKRLVYLSSFGVYGKSLERKENQYPHPVSPYGITKLYNEQVVHSIAQQTETDVLVIRPTGVIGPNPHGSGNWMSKEINRIFQCKGGVMKVSARLRKPQEYLDVRDLSRFIADSLRKGFSTDIVNIGPGKLTDGEELLGILQYLLKVPVYFEESPYDFDDAVSPLPIDKAKIKYNFEPQYDLAMSLSYIGDYYDQS